MPSFLGLPELGLLLVILLLLFGPGKLPQVAKAIGESIQQFKKSASGGTEPSVTTTSSVNTAPPTEVLTATTHANTPTTNHTDTPTTH
jgi:sec-independent protein translocase protein TatA